MLDFEASLQDNLNQVWIARGGKATEKFGRPIAQALPPSLVVHMAQQA